MNLDLFLTQEAHRMVNVSLADLPASFAYLAYRCDPYIRAAATLQAEGHKRACDSLSALAKDAEGGDKVIILCRMLFTPRAEREFRRPAIGDLKLFGETESTDWPLEPIELVDGVPFLVFDAPYRGLAGLAESGESYLRYCVSDCDWRPFRFVPKNSEAKEKALAKLLGCGRWRAPLEDHEVERLSGQIQP
jgi:hypothetical protein